MTQNCPHAQLLCCYDDTIDHGGDVGRYPANGTKEEKDEFLEKCMAKAKAQAKLDSLRTQLTIESNSLRQANLIEYLIANVKLKLREERAFQIHIPSWKLHFVSHLCSQV